MFVLGLALFLSVTFFLVFRWIKRLRTKTLEMLRDELRGVKVYAIRDCNFFGLQSLGFGQMRGNGLLALTARELRFRMLLPRRSLCIPLASVEEVSYPRWFLRRYKGGDLLRVDFIGEKGDRDACAWLLKDPQAWGRAIAALREGGQPDLE